MSTNVVNGAVMPPLADGTYQIVPLRPKSGYWVSQRDGIEVAPNSPQQVHDIALGQIVRRVRDAQSYMSHPVFIGVWTDDKGVTCYDVSYLVDDLERALNLAYANSQRAIWDISADTPISVITRRF